MRSEWSLEIYTNQPKQFQSRDSRAREFFPPLAIRSPCPRRLVGRPRKSSEKHTRQAEVYFAATSLKCAKNLALLTFSSRGLGISPLRELVFDLLSGAATCQSERKSARVRAIDYNNTNEPSSDMLSLGKQDGQGSVYEDLSVCISLVYLHCV